jgi:hypothetical protein
MQTSVMDPDSYVFRPPEPGSVSQKYKSGTDPDTDPSIIKQQNNNKKTLFLQICNFCMTFYL